MILEKKHYFSMKLTIMKVENMYQLEKCKGKTKQNLKIFVQFLLL